MFSRKVRTRCWSSQGHILVLTVLCVSNSCCALLPASQGQNLALTVLCVPYSKQGGEPFWQQVYQLLEKEGEELVGRCERSAYGPGVFCVPDVHGSGVSVPNVHCRCIGLNHTLTESVFV